MPVPAPEQAAVDPAGDATEDGLGAYLEASMLQLDGRHPEAVRFFLRALAADSSQAAPRLGLAISYTEMGQPDSALFWAEAAARGEPESAEPHRIAGLNLARLGRAREAVAAFERALERDPEDLSARMSVLGLLEVLRDHEASLRVLDEAPPGIRSMDPFRVRRARLLLQLDRPEEAVPELTFVLRREGAFPEAEALLLLALGRGDDPERNIPEAESLLVARPDLHRVRAAVARLLLATEGWRAAEPHVLRLLEEQPGEPVVRRLEGLLRFRQERFEEAERAFREAQEAAPRDPEALRWLCRIALVREDAAEALRLASRIQTLEPGDPEGLFCQALALASIDRKEEALAAVQALLAAEPGDRAAGLLGSAILGELRRFPEAVAMISEVRERYPEDPEVTFRLGALLEQSGRVDSALAVFDTLLAAAPDDHRALNYAGYMCIERGIRLEQAVERVRRALELEPENGAYLDSYGWGLHRVGRTEEALDFLERAAERSPEEAVIHRHLGEVRSALGRTEEARSSLRRARDLDPEDRETGRLLDDLEGEDELGSP